jgi:hypothetical protein
MKIRRWLTMKNTDKTQVRVTKSEEKMLKLLRAYDVEPRIVVKKVLGVPLELAQ